MVPHPIPCERHLQQHIPSAALPDSLAVPWPPDCSKYPERRRLEDQVSCPPPSTTLADSRNIAQSANLWMCLYSIMCLLWRCLGESLNKMLPPPKRKARRQLPPKTKKKSPHSLPNVLYPFLEETTMQLVAPMPSAPLRMSTPSKRYSERPWRLPSRLPLVKHTEMNYFLFFFFFG